MQLGKFPRLLPKEFEAKLAYACIVFGRKYKGGWVGLQIFLEKLSMAAVLRRGAQGAPFWERRTELWAGLL